MFTCYMCIYVILYIYIYTCIYIYILLESGPGGAFPIAFHLFARIMQREGVTGLWRGNLAVIMRVMPYAGIQFASFDRYKAGLRSVPVLSENTIVLSFTAGAMEGASS